MLAAAFALTSVEPLEYLVAALLDVLIIPILEIVKLIQRHCEGENR